MKKAFSLVELLVAVAIVLVLSAGAFVYINRGIQRQALLKASSQVVSDFKMANSLAKTRQMPLGASGNLKVIEIYFNGTDKKLYLNAISTIGTTVNFSQNLVEANVTDNTRRFFYAGTGFLGKNTTDTMYAAGETTTINMTLNESKNMSIPIFIDAMGQVTQGEVIEN